jgi:methylated-DNA-[protein]-cysteine S-methyltransferase
MPVLHARTPGKITQREGPVCLVVASPLGDIVIRGERDVIRSIRFQPGQANQNTDIADWVDRCRQQVTAYCCGELQTFDLPVKPLGTDFQQQVWLALQQIPYGELRSYQQLAEAINNPGSVRAVASANARNPVSLVVPCHRVIGSDNALRGYAGGIKTKAKLLELEGHQIQAGEITLTSKVLDHRQTEFELR